MEESKRCECEEGCGKCKYVESEGNIECEECINDKFVIAKN